MVLLLGALEDCHWTWDELVGMQPRVVKHVFWIFGQDLVSRRHPSFKFSSALQFLCNAHTAAKVGLSFVIAGICHVTGLFRIVDLDIRSQNRQAKRRVHVKHKRIAIRLAVRNGTVDGAEFVNHVHVRAVYHVEGRKRYLFANSSVAKGDHAQIWH